MAVEEIELEHAGMIVGNSRITEEDCPQAAPGSVEETRLVTLDRPVLQHLKAKAIPAKAQAGLKVAHHHDGMMNGSGHRHEG